MVKYMNDICCLSGWFIAARGGLLVKESLMQCTMLDRFVINLHKARFETSLADECYYIVLRCKNIYIHTYVVILFDIYFLKEKKLSIYPIASRFLGCFLVRLVVGLVSRL